MHNKFEVTELDVKVYLLNSIKKEEQAFQISRLIDKCFAHDENYIEFHEKNKFKMYNFDFFYPIRENGIYEKGGIYTFRIRTVDNNLVEYFEKYLANEYTDSIKALTIMKRVIPRKYIERIYSITPAVIKCENGYWKNNITLQEYEDRIKVNLIKKYNFFNNTKIDENFELFTYIKFLNHKPIASVYKKITLLGDKLTINVSENDLAQELTYFALGVGISEVNARGFGFMNFKWL